MPQPIMPDLVRRLKSVADPSLSPDGSRLAYTLSRIAGDEWKAQSRIVILDLTTERASELTDGDPAKAGSAEIANAYVGGDPLVVEVLDELVSILGVSLGNAVTLLSLDRIVIGAVLGEALGDLFCARLQSAVRATAFPDQCKDVQVVPSILRENAGLLGAALRGRDLIA